MRPRVLGLLAEERVGLGPHGRVGDAGHRFSRAATMYRSNAGARNVNALANTPNAGFAGCHWKGTVSSIRKAGRRTTRFVIKARPLHIYANM